MSIAGNIRHKRTACRQPRLFAASGTNLVTQRPQEYPMAGVLNPTYWDKKIKIAILAFATFAAMC